MALFHSQMRRHMINRGSYISAQALLNSLNELGEKIKCEIAEHCIPQLVGLQCVIAVFPDHTHLFEEER